MKETIKHFFIEEKGSPLNVLMAGVSICDKDHSYTRNNPNITIVEYVFQGEGTLEIDNKKIDVKTDDVYILPTGVSHRYYANPKNPWSKYFMNLSGVLAKSLPVNFELDTQYVFTAPALKDLFKKMIQVSFSELSDIEKQAILGGLYFEILYKLFLLNKESKKSSEAILLKNFLDENYNRIISNVELADHIYRSTDYCLKLFKREFGTTPYDYQLHNKIKISCTLLQHTKKSVSEIAEFIGYQNPHYFTSLFKAKVGITPTQYRKKYL